MIAVLKGEPAASNAEGKFVTLLIFANSSGDWNLPVRIRYATVFLLFRELPDYSLTFVLRERSGQARSYIGVNGALD